MKVLIIECEVPEGVDFPMKLDNLSYWSTSYLYHTIPIRGIKTRIEERDEPNKVQPSS